MGLFRVQGPVVYVQNGAVIVSGLHGDLHKLLRIFCEHGKPPETSYIFLGDFVDGGQYSLEVVELLFTLAISYPSNVFLVRGKSEFYELNNNGGFQDEVILTYRSPSIYEEFLVPFAFLPTAAIIMGKIFCTYGCATDKIVELAQIQEIALPIEPESQISLALCYGNNPRDASEMLPDEKATIDFLNTNNLEFYICASGKKDQIQTFCNGKAASLNRCCGKISSDAVFSPINVKQSDIVPRIDAQFENITPQFDPFNKKGVCNLRTGGTPTSATPPKKEGFNINASVSLLKIPSVATGTVGSLTRILNSKARSERKTEKE